MARVVSVTERIPIADRTESIQYRFGAYCALFVYICGGHYAKYGPKGRNWL